MRAMDFANACDLLTH